MSNHELEQQAQSTHRDKILHIKLTADIERFERQLANLKTSGNYASFADVHTLKELIRTRQDMLRRLK